MAMIEHSSKPQLAAKIQASRRKYKGRREKICRLTYKARLWALGERATPLRLHWQYTPMNASVKHPTAIAVIWEC
jgi:hypothetical protein